MPAPIQELHPHPHTAKLYPYETPYPPTIVSPSDNAHMEPTAQTHPNSPDTGSTPPRNIPHPNPKPAFLVLRRKHLTNRLHHLPEHLAPPLGLRKMLPQMRRLARTP